MFLRIVTLLLFCIPILLAGFFITVTIFDVIAKAFHG